MMIHVSADRSKTVLLLQYFFVCASVDCDYAVVLDFFVVVVVVS